MLSDFPEKNPLFTLLTSQQSQLPIPASRKLSREAQLQKQREAKRAQKNEQRNQRSIQATVAQSALSGTIPEQDPKEKILNLNFSRSNQEPFHFCSLPKEQSDVIKDHVAKNFPYSLRDGFFRYLTYFQDVNWRDFQKNPNQAFVNNIRALTRDLEEKENIVNLCYEEIALAICSEEEKKLFQNAKPNKQSSPEEINHYYAVCKAFVNSKPLNDFLQERLSPPEHELYLARRSRFKCVHDYFIANTRLHVNNFPHDSETKQKVKLACNISEKLFEHRTKLLEDSYECSRIGPLEQYKLIKNQCKTMLDSLTSIFKDMNISGSEIESLLAETKKDQEAYTQKLDLFKKLRSLLMLDINYLGILQLIDEMVSNPDFEESKASALSDAICNYDFFETKAMIEFILDRKIQPQETLNSLKQTITQNLTDKDKLTKLKSWIITKRLNSEYGLEETLYNRVPDTSNAVTNLQGRIVKKIKSLSDSDLKLSSLLSREFNVDLKSNEQLLDIVKASRGKVQDFFSKRYQLCTEDVDLIRSTFLGRLDTHVLQKALISKGLIEAEPLDNSGGDPVMGVIDTSQDIRTINTNEEGFMPINVSSIISADGKGITNPHLSFNGSLYHSRKEFEQEHRPFIELSKKWYEDMKRVFRDSGFDWMNHPEGFGQYLVASSVAALNDRSTESLLAKYRDHYEIKYAHKIQSRAYIESQLANDQEYIYGAPTAGYSSNLEVIMKETDNNKDLRELIQKYGDKFQKDGTHWANDPNWRTLVDVPIEVESSLRQLAESPLTMNSLAENLAPFVIYSQDYQLNNNGKYRWASSIQLLILLTSKITNGVRDTHGLDWSPLLNYDPSQETLEKYKRDYEAFKKNPEDLKSRDKLAYTLMKVRNIWYEYFKNKMPDFSKHDGFKKEIQKIAKQILNEEFIPYSERLTNSPGWQEVYKNKIAKTISMVC